VPAPRAPVEVYTVQRGDTLIRIARKLWGRRHEGKYRLIFQANRDKLRNVSTLAPGQVLVIPPLEQAPRAGRSVTPVRPVRPHYEVTTLEALGSRLKALRLYTVRPGDSLTSIARRQMGDGSSRAVQRLHHANRSLIRDPDELPVGLTLRIPS
jgi:nucleoid-associated protein YgaU